jgi:hypothetical protein
MKNIIAFILYCLSVTAIIGQTTGDVRLSVQANSIQETIIDLSLDGVIKTPVSTPQGEAVLVSFEQGTPLLQAGAPDLPKYALSLLLPPTGNMAVEILASEYQDYPNVQVAPSKGDLKRNINPATVPYTYSSVYEHDAFFPGKLSDLHDPFIFRDVRGQSMWIYPVQYNPQTKVLRVYAHLTLRVYRTGGQGANELNSATERPVSKTFQQMYSKFFRNYNNKTMAQSRSVESPEKMLIICKDDLIPELDAYVTWKRQSGIQTEVVAVSEIGAANPAGLFDYVKNYYNANGITYLLLIGDEGAIEPMVRPGSDYSCDNCLGYMEGDDHFPEILVGRFHAANAAQLHIMMNRNLEYEKTPLADPAANWCATGMASASNEGDGIGDDNQADWQQGNEWKDKHLTDGYEKYYEFYDGSHGAQSPTPGDESADASGNPTNGPLVELMNGRGVSLYNYTGHGWEQGLVSGNFNTDAVANLRNHHRYPFLIAVACCAGNFTNNGGGDCLGEAIQRAGDAATGEAWGAIGGFFSSDFQSWAPPMEGQDGMNQYLIDADGINLDPTIGSMGAYGNALMIAAYGQGGIDMADVWNPFHDPTTIPRTRLPQTLSATHAPVLFLGMSSLSVNCETEGAQVSLYWQGQTLAVATVQNGVAALEFPALNNVGELVVTVTHFNGAPYQGNINVTPSAGAFVINQSNLIDDSSTGNNNGKADFGENLLMHLTLANVGPELADATAATLSISDDYIEIIDGTEAFGALAGNESLEKIGAFAFKVADDVPDGYVATFNLHLDFNGTQTFDAAIPVKIQAPELQIASFTLSDTQGGDGDGRLEDGETGTITVKNLNVGHAGSPNATGKLSCDSPWLTISDNFLLGSINALTGAADATFFVNILPGAPKAFPVVFHYTVEAGNYGTENSYGPYIINAIIETFESQNFAAFPWEMSGNKPWVIATSGAYTGQYCSRSGTITHNQKSEMNLTLEFATDGVVSFARRTNTEENYDFLRFLIDGVEIEKWSGLNPWAEVNYPITAGVHKLSWIYEKDQVGSSGSDRAWVDDILLPPYLVVVNTDAPVEKAFEVGLSPNPANGRTWLQLDMPEQQKMSIRLFDQLGRRSIDFQDNDRMLSGQYRIELPLGDLTPGVYYVQVQGEKMTRLLKLVVAP